MFRNVLVIVDPQNDFCDPKGSLYVEGAVDDIMRLSRYIRKKGADIDAIFVSLDSHDPVTIFHPVFWVDKDGKHPAPFTSITIDDFLSSVWKTALDANESYAERLFGVLEECGEESLMIWPEHCVVSTWGHEIAAPLRDALQDWREKTGSPVRYVFKGENPYTEQFSAFEGLDRTYFETAFNENFFARILRFKWVTFAGEALSHCVQESILSCVRMDKDLKARLLTDCTSPVKGFDRNASLETLRKAGVALITTEDA
jgi:nicotinamidase-related amidase